MGLGLLRKKGFVPFVVSMVIVGLALIWVPRIPVDPWGLINFFKLLQLIFFLALIQVISMVIMGLFNKRFGGIALGFLGGLISSTAFAVSLAKQSHECTDDEVRLYSLSYLSALLGMLLEGFVLVYMGVSSMHWEILYIFMAPFLMTAFLMKQRHESIQHIDFKDDPYTSLNPFGLIKLSLFIGFVLALSKILQNFLGQYGLYILTFIICLFELHGSVIANVQIHESGALSVRALGNLVTLGLLSSYIAKMGIIVLLGNEGFKRRIIGVTNKLLLSLGIGWWLFTISV